MKAAGGAVAKGAEGFEALGGSDGCSWREKKRRSREKDRRVRELWDFFGPSLSDLPFFFFFFRIYLSLSFFSDPIYSQN